jgi:hypothetical protein
MDRLSIARERLYGAGPQGSTRAMLIRFTQAGDWEALANLYQAVQEELALPAPALSVSGDQGYGLWFSLAQPVALDAASDFLAALRARYLAELPPARTELLPDIAKAPAVPAQQAGSNRWSAYIDPTLGAMFSEEPWLEMAPNPDKQADLLVVLESIKAADFQQALAQLQATPVVPGNTDHASPPGTLLQAGSQFSDPQSFLLAVMNDASASPELRVEAAKALLPYVKPRSAG